MITRLSTSGTSINPLTDRRKEVIKYDPISDTLTRDGKRIGRRHRDWQEVASHWVYSCIAGGDDLDTILSKSSKVLPTFEEIIQFEEENPEFAVKHQRAKSVRLLRAQEKFVGIINRVYESGDKEDLELLKGMKQSLEYLIKSTGSAAASIHFHNVFPDSFWSTPSEDLELEVQEGALDNK